VQVQEDPKTRRGISGNLKTILIVLSFFALTLGATALEIAVKNYQERPLFGNVVALALLNINILLLAVLLLLLGRQLVKFYFERKRSPFGAGFRSKLITAFIGLSMIPAAVLFVVAIGLLTAGVKFWFGPRVDNTIRSSMTLADSYTEEKKAAALHFAETIADSLHESDTGQKSVQAAIEKLRIEYGLDLVEAYDTHLRRTASAGPQYAGPVVGSYAGFIEKAYKERRLSGLVSYGDRQLICGAAAFYDSSGRRAGLVTAGYLPPPAVSSNLTDISRFYKEYWDLQTFKNPLKKSYILSFILIALVIAFAALWFGLYLSKGIMVPITSLAEATHRISRGDYDFQIEVEARDELGVLVDSFKRMTLDLKNSQARVKAANLTLRETNVLLGQRKHFIETVLENVNAGVFTIDRAGKISTMNQAAERITGLPGESVLGRGYREVFEFHQLDEIREQIGNMVEGGQSRLEKDIQLTINRRTLHLRLFISVLNDADGGYLGILVVFDDLTELIKAQRAAAWKEVARRIAHEVKNPLTPIQLSAQRLRKRFLEGTGDYEGIIDDCTSTIIKQVESMKELVDEFSRFARMPEAKPAPNDLHEIIDGVVTLYTGAHHEITVNREYDPDMPVVNVDGEQMKRVFVNLFDNAVTAMDGSGGIWIKTAYDRESGTARVEVADEGVGILPEDRERLFQPYFSKKKSGTGLGLAIVNRIISDHGGYIRVQGNQPRGARFIIELPAGA